MTDDERAAMVRDAAARIAQARKDSAEFDGGYPATDAGRMQSILDHCMLAEDWFRLSAEVARLTDYIKSLETTAAQWLNTNQKEIARLRGLNAELIEAGSGAILAAMAFDQTDRERKENAERERRWAAACEQAELWDAVAGRAAG